VEGRKNLSKSLYLFLVMSKNKICERAKKMLNFPNVNLCNYSLLRMGKKFFFYLFFLAVAACLFSFNFISLSFCVSFLLSPLMRIYFCNLFDFTVDNFSPLSIPLFFPAVVAISHARQQQNETHKSSNNPELPLPYTLTFIHLFVCFVSLFFFRGRPEHLRDERQSDEQLETTADEESEEAIVIVQLSNRVQDGTRCRPGSLDMCIQGKCQVGTMERCKEREREKRRRNGKFVSTNDLH
jgi:hypothetical protein